MQFCFSCAKIIDMKYQVIVNTSVKDRPKDYEMSASLLLAEYFRTNIVFLRPTANKTPDLNIKGIVWELKSPIGDGKYTIQNNLRKAKHQSGNIILDLARIKMHERRAISQAEYIIKNHKVSSIKQLVIIRKSKKVVVLK